VRGFGSTVLHEFRTPLTGILGFSELLRDEQLSPAEQHELAADISSETRRLARMIGEMLDLDRMEPGKVVLNRGSVNLSSVLREMVDHMRATTAGHVIHLQLGADVPEIVADRDKIGSDCDQPALERHQVLT
jgi:signal transduction histidine kinase